MGGFEFDSADVDWKATAEELQREVTRLNRAIVELNQQITDLEDGQRTIAWHESVD